MKWQDISVDIKTLSPGLNSWKKKQYKIRLQRDFFLNLQQMMFLLTLKFHSQGVVRPCPGAIYMYKIMKKNHIKSDFKEIFFKLVANE